MQEIIALVQIQNAKKKALRDAVSRRASHAQAQTNELIWIVSYRPGPTPMAEIGAPDISSSAFT